MKAIREHCASERPPTTGRSLRRRWRSSTSWNGRFSPLAPGGKNLRAVDRALGIMDRRARMLGLDSPSRVEVHMRVEEIAKAIELVVVEMGLERDAVRPIPAPSCGSLTVSKN